MAFLNWLFKPTKISYGITVCNEAAELEKLLEFVIRHKDAEDEIIVLQDVTSRDEAVTAVIRKYSASLHLQESYLAGDFSTFKNNFMSLAKGDYLFQIDADEIPELSLMSKLKPFLKKKYRSDCFLVPRINIVNGISQAHIDKWEWNMNDKNWANFPDYQARIFKLNGKIRWQNRVHEQLVNYKKQSRLPDKNADYCLRHIKSIEKQVTQDEFYKQLV